MVFLYSRIVSRLLCMAFFAISISSGCQLSNRSGACNQGWYQVGNQCIFLPQTPAVKHTAGSSGCKRLGGTLLSSTMSDQVRECIVSLLKGQSSTEIWIDIVRGIFQQCGTLKLTSRQRRTVKCDQSVTNPRSYICQRPNSYSTTLTTPESFISDKSKRAISLPTETTENVPLTPPKIQEETPHPFLLRSFFTTTSAKQGPTAVSTTPESLFQATTHESDTTVTGQTQREVATNSSVRLTSVSTTKTTTTRANVKWPSTSEVSGNINPAVILVEPTKEAEAGKATVNITTETSETLTTPRPKHCPQDVQVSSMGQDYVTFMWRHQSQYADTKFRIFVFDTSTGVMLSESETHQVSDGGYTSIKVNSLSSTVDYRFKIGSAFENVTEYICDDELPKISYCEEDRNVVTFVRTRGGATLHVPCPEFYEGNITRTCNKTTKSWTPFSQYNCTRKRLRIASNLAKDLRNQSGEDLQEIVRNISSEVTSALESDLLIVSGDIRQIVNILEEIGTVSEGLAVSNETLQNLATITDKLIAADTSTWEELSTANKTEDTGSTLLEAMDNITSTLLKSDVIETLIVKDNIVITVASTGVNKDNITFPKTDHPTYSTNQTSNRVFLSSDALSGHVAYSVIIYTNVSEKFKVHSSIQRQRIGSDVISFSMGSNSSNLSSPLILTFKTEKSRQDAVCAFLDTTSHISGVWSARGCKTFLRETTIDCHCSHLTNFAVLMSMREASPIHQAILSYVSIIGISISLFCLCLTVTVYSVMWRYVKSDRSVLHVHLCACLMLGYIVFLGGISKTEHRIACAVAAALLHYLFLAVFFVMLSQGLLILKSVTSVSATSILRYLFILMYGAPLIIVAISLGITKGEGFGTEKACWLSPNNGALWAFVGPAFTVIVVNSFILFAVIRIMQKSRTMMDKNVKRKTKSVVRSIFILAPILGVTWALGVLSVTMDLVIFQYSFAICNSLQGLFIFIFQCVLQYQIKDGFRALMRRYRASSFDSSQRLTSTGQSQGKGYSESGQKMTSLTNTSGSCKSQD